MKFIPSEIVNLIADYHDYNKYCKPKHKKLFNSVLIDIKTISKIMPCILPNIVWNCWGPGSKYLENSYTSIFYENMVGQHIDDFVAAMSQPDMIALNETIVSDFENDDEENNFGLDYDDTFYYSS